MLKVSFFVILFVFITNSFALKLVVISSNASFKAGEVFDGSKEFNLKTKENMTLMDESGKNYNLKGPYKGTYKEEKGDPVTSTVTSIGKGVKRLFEGDKNDESAVGATRLGRERIIKGRSINSEFIDVENDVTFCVTNPLNVKFVRSDSNNPIKFKLQLTGSTKKEEKEINFPQGEILVPWPKEVSLKDNSLYLMRLENSSIPKKLELHVMPSNLNEDIEKRRWLIDKKCFGQVFLI